jgi:hypothetical protein
MAATTVSQPDSAIRSLPCITGEAPDPFAHARPSAEASEGERLVAFGNVLDRLSRRITGKRPDKSPMYAGSSRSPAMTKNSGAESADQVARQEDVVDQRSCRFEVSHRTRPDLGGGQRHEPVPDHRAKLVRGKVCDVVAADNPVATFALSDLEAGR